VINGGASVTMSLTSIAMTQTGLENGTRSRDPRLVRGCRGWFRQIEFVLHKRDHQIGIIVHPGAVDRRTGAETTGGIRAECFELIRVEVDGHDSF
jgi:hypothetical protein